MAKQTKALSTILKDLVAQSNNQTRRMRVLEENADILTTRMEAVEDTLLQRKKKRDQLLTDIETRTKQIDVRMTEIEKQIKEIVNEVKKMPTAVQVKELEQLIQIFNPLKSNFITKDEIKQLLERRRV